MHKHVQKNTREPSSGAGLTFLHAFRNIEALIFKIEKSVSEKSEVQGVTVNEFQSDTYERFKIVFILI